jgi:hypothetical protein
VSANTPSKPQMPDFVARFAHWWSAPDPQRLGELLAPDIELVQPLLPNARGLDEAKRTFARLLAAIPDLRATVHAWAENEDLVFIDFTLHGSGLEWRAIDRFTVEDGLARVRVSRFDPLPLIVGALHPARWPLTARLIRASLSH